MTQLQWLNKMLSFLDSGENITLPIEYRARVLAVESLLESDTSGVVSSLLDFAVNSAISDIHIETSNKSVTKLLNDWLKDINSNKRGRVPVGYKAFAQQYYGEMWKRSSFLLTRTKWETQQGYKLPTNMWLVDGADIVVEDKNKEVKTIGDERYKLYVNQEKSIYIPENDNNKLFVQKPFNKWTDLVTNPFIVQRGIYENLTILKTLFSKSYKITKSAEFLNLIKKGAEQLAKTGNPDFIYSKDELTLVKDGLRDVIEASKNANGAPTWVTNFDTEFESIIPEYEKALKGALYAPIERRLLACLGIVDIVQGTASSRKESLLNPKPFISMINKGKSDFEILLSDIIETFVEMNKASHRKVFGKNWSYSIYSSPSYEFITKELMDHLRSMRDRGQLSGRTYSELVGQGSIDFDVEVNRRKEEDDKEGIPKMKPVPQAFTDLVAQEKVDDGQESNKEEVTDVTKIGPEAKNFTNAKVKEESTLDKELKEKKLKVAQLQQELLEKHLKSEDLDENIE